MLLQIWTCLAENAVYVADREACFNWFSMVRHLPASLFLCVCEYSYIEMRLFYLQLMADEPDLDPEINREFFESNILQLDPCLLTESGMT